MKQSWESTLFDIQELDLKIAALEANLATHPGRLDAIKKQFAELKQRKEDAAQKVTEIQLAIRKTEGQIEDLKKRKKEFQDKTALIRSNEEYKAALTQMALCDKSVSDLEGALVEYMDKQEEALQHQKDIAKTIEDAKVVGGAELEAIERERQENKKEIDALNAQRQALVGGVPADIMGRYDRLRTAPTNNRLRPVFVPVVKDVCGRCKVKQTPQTIINVRKGVTSFCSSCGAIFYER